MGCLACYNAGTLRGAWVNAIDAGDFVPCEGRGHEEFWVLDHEGFNGFLKGECSPAEAQRTAEKMLEWEDCGVPMGAIAERVADMYGGDIDGFDPDDGSYAGEWESAEEFAQDLAESCGYLDRGSSWPYTYIDWEAATRDLMFGYTEYRVDGVSFIWQNF